MLEKNINKLNELEISKKSFKSKTMIKTLWFYIGWLIPAVLALVVQRILAQYPAWTEKYYSTGVFRIISWP